MDVTLDSVRNRLREAQSVVVYVGPELSAETHVEEVGGSVDDSVVTNPPELMATPDTFRRDPARLWRWYLWRRDRIPRPESPDWVYALARFARVIPTLTVITENVDGVLSGHGLDVLELHGSLWRSRCLGCNRVRELGSVYRDQLPPKCDHCMEVLRPDVVLFGETLDSRIIERAMRLACSTEVLLVVGSQGLVATSATMVTLAAENGAYVIDVDGEMASEGNPRQIDATFRGPCKGLLSDLLR